MKELVQELPIGKVNQGIDLYATVQVEGQQPERFKCESFLGAFVRELYGLMSGGKFARPAVMAGYNADGSPSRATDSNTEIKSITTNGSDEIIINTSRLLFNSANNWNASNPQRAYLWGVQGIPEANGVHYIEKIDNYSAYLVDAAGNRLTSTGNYTTDTGRVVTYQNYPYRSSTDNFVLGLSQWRVVVGAGTSPVKASDISLDQQIQHGSGTNQLVPDNISSYGAQTTDKPTTRMTLTRSFTNNSGQSIDVNEIGIITSTSSYTQNSDYMQFLIVRDVFGSTKSVPVGKKITIDYEIVFRLSPDTQDTDTDGTNGGFLQEFLNLLRTDLVNDIDFYRYYFNMGMAGGIGNSTESDDLLGWQYGLRLGTDNTFTSMTDASLIAGIDHGDQDGQLWYHGTSFNPPAIDDQANEAYFSVFRIYQNRGSTPITIAEMGLYGNDEENGFSASPALLTRTALAPSDQQTVQPGEYILAKYIIKAIV